MTEDDLDLQNESVTSIDKGRLDKEWEGQADRYFDYAKLLAEAKHDVLELETELKVVEAEAELDIRNRPKKNGIKGPVREAAVKLRVPLHIKVRKIRRKLNQAKFRSELLNGAVRALDHRKTALENLVILDGRAYFARPVDREKAEEFKKGVGKKKRRVKHDPD